MKVPSFAEVTALFVDEIPEPVVVPLPPPVEVVVEVPVEVQVPIPIPVVKEDVVIRTVARVGSLLKKAVVRETVYHTQGEIRTERSVRWGLVVGTAGLAITCWAGYKAYGYIQELKSSKASKQEVPSIELKSDDFVAAPECVREGSAFKQGSPVCVPAGQVALAWEKAEKSNDGKTTVYFVVGAAQRINNWAVFPTHSIMASKKMFLIKPGQGDAPPAVLALNMDEVVSVYPDISAVYLEEAEFTKLGLKKVRLGKPTFGDAAQVTTMVDYKYSTGVIQQSKERFGHLEYHGSTAPGFSGSAYQVGQTTVGMHMHGGSVNGGIELAFLLVLLRYLEKLLGKPTTHKVPNGVLAPEARRAATEGSDYIPDNSGRLEVSHIGPIDDVQYCAVRTSNGDYRLTTEERIRALNELRKKQKTGKLSWADEVELDDLEREARPMQCPPVAPVVPAVNPAVAGPSRVVQGYDEVVAEARKTPPPSHVPQQYPAMPLTYGQYLPPGPSYAQVPAAYGQYGAMGPVPHYPAPPQRPPPRAYVPEAVMMDGGLAYPGEYPRPGALANPGSAIYSAPQASSSKSVAAQQKRTDRQRYVNLVSNLSNDSLALIHRLHHTGELQKLVTSQPTPAQRQSGPPSQPNSVQPQSSGQQ